MKSAQEIRTEFLHFFDEKGHEIIASDSLVPANDPTLLFTNAGMNQFKDVFLGDGTRPYKRAVDTQKCLRVSGKHNDLEEVGRDTYHHTFFEMLGNWSFGDYFKSEAIEWAWELLVGIWGMDPDRLYVTVHEGDTGLGLDADEEAAAFWRSNTSLAHDHILYCSSKDNFWMMGDTGPCGPCSEVHIDTRSAEERTKIPGRDLVNADHPQVIEIWNLVFIQYNAQKTGGLEPLPAKHVDTGMGFERVVAVLQGKSSNYDTDLFLPLLNRAATLSPLSGMNSYADPGGDTDDDVRKRLVALRVIADHIRTVSFSIADGAAPGNVGRGYVIRRILRRAVRYGYQTLDLKKPFLFDMVATVVDLMGDQFPELSHNVDFIRRIVRAEEESFLETLGTGLQYFERLLPYIKQFEKPETFEFALSALRSDRVVQDLLKKAWRSKNDDHDVSEAFSTVAKDRMLPGEIAFLLHDTYGFPIDLTELIVGEEDLIVDMERYRALMDGQKNLARAAATFDVDMSETDVWQVVSDGEDSAFVGYDTDAVTDSCVRMMRETTGEQSAFEIILDRTPFYAESGGQVGDTGYLVIGDDRLSVLNTRKVGGQIIHYVDRPPSSPESNVGAFVDDVRRLRIRKHHSVTHLLHAALREELGAHVSQKGSLVAPNHLRFDFSHFERVEPDVLRRVEDRVNQVIQANIQRVEERDIPVQEALSRGAMALFGEKYGEFVRVITFDSQYSIELCGGLHVERSGDIGLFKFVSEGSVAAGIRRVEAVAGVDALEYVTGQMDELSRVRSQFKSNQRPSDEEVADLVSANKRLEKALETERLAGLEAKLGTLFDSGIQVGGIRLIRGTFEGVDMNQLRTLGQGLKEKMDGESIGILGSRDTENGKVYLVCAVADDLVAARGLSAGSIVGQLAKLLGGGGGGKPGLATAGGKKPELLDSVMESSSEIIAQLLV